MKRQSTERSVSIVGPGNWGSSLAHGLQSAGVPLLEVIAAREQRRQAGAAANRTITSLDNATLNATILWLCVPDGAIRAVASRVLRRAALLGIRMENRLFVHSSGALGAEVLEPAALAGAEIASVHPVMSFATRKPVSLAGVPFGVEANASERRILNRIIRRMGGRPFSVPVGNKALYHAAGMFASPLLVSHLAAALQTAELAGFSPQEARALMEPIARATLDNFFERGARESFSGPIARGDGETIRLHLRALKSHPMLAGVYRWLALYALEIVPPVERRKLRRWLRST